MEYRKLFKDTTIHGLPVVFIIFSVLGLLYLGIATPSESAASGAFASLIVAFIYRNFNWERLRAALLATTRVTGMVFFIMIGSKAYSQIMALSGAGKGFANIVLNIPLPPFVLLLLMLLVLIFLGMFLDPASIMFITIPLYKPIILALGYDMLWVGIMYMMCMEIGLITPPFGLNLFVTKAVSPPDVRIIDIFRGIVPFVIMDIIAVALVFIFPSIATWLPGTMGA